jgi:hypothetical protein
MGMQYATLVMPSCKYHVIALATRQVDPRIGDLERAQRVLQYMMCRAEKSMYIYAYGVDPTIYTYTDAAFDVYDDSVSHSGVSVFIGCAGAAMYSASNKQKCVTESSSAAETVAAGGGLHISQYYRCFLQEIGVQCNVVQYQDNRSCISLVRTGCTAWDKKDRHIVRRINYMKEYFDKVEHCAELLWCDTAWMIADGLTKDLHGIAFEINENILMGHAVGDVGDYGVKVEKTT